MPPLCREMQSLGQQMLNASVVINGLIYAFGGIRQGICMLAALVSTHDSWSITTLGQFRTLAYSQPWAIPTLGQSHPWSIPTLGQFPPQVNSQHWYIPTLGQFPPLVNSHPRSFLIILQFLPWVNSHPMIKFAISNNFHQGSIPNPGLSPTLGHSPP